MCVCGLWVCWYGVGGLGGVDGVYWVFWVGWVCMYDMVATWRLGVPWSEWVGLGGVRWCVGVGSCMRCGKLLGVVMVGLVDGEWDMGARWQVIGSVGEGWVWYGTCGWEGGMGRGWGFL